MKNRKPILGITMGDPASIGPEVAVKALLDSTIYQVCQPVLVGEAAIFEQAIQFCGLDLKINSISKIPDAKFEKELASAWTEIAKGLDDDFGTPQALAKIFDVVRLFNSQAKRGLKANPALIAKAQSFKKFILKTGALMALFQEPPAQFLRTLDDMLLLKKNLKREDVDQIVQARAQARIAKDFKKSDEYRDQLLAMGIAVSDTATGSEWEVSK